MTGVAPTVSVVIPAYNGAAWLPATLDSLTAQTLQDWEAIVVDDCSPDDGAALVEAWPDPRVRLVRMTENGGPVRARNFGVGHARGRYIAGLDQDDVCRPERLARQVAYLDAHPDIVLLGTQAEALQDGAVSPLGYAAKTTPALMHWLTWIENPYVWSTIMVRGDVAHSLDPFTRPEILYAEDFDLYHRIVSHGDIARLDEPLLLYRVHDGGVSKRFIETMRGSARRVLTEAHAHLFGEQSGAVADLLMRYVMGKEAVPDRATLLRLLDTIARLQAAFFTRHRPDPASDRLIRRETALRLRAICRVGLRTGRLTLSDVNAARRTDTGPVFMPPTALLSSAVIGAMRRACQTFAEKIIRSGPSRANT